MKAYRCKIGTKTPQRNHRVLVLYSICFLFRFPLARNSHRCTILRFLCVFVSHRECQQLLHQFHFHFYLSHLCLTAQIDKVLCDTSMAFVAYLFHLQIQSFHPVIHWTCFRRCYLTYSSLRSSFQSYLFDCLTRCANI